VSPGPGRAILLLLAGAVGGPPSAGQAATPASPWVPPVGVPRPEFGLEETVEVSCAGCTLRRQGNLRALDRLDAGTIVQLEGGPLDAQEGLEVNAAGTKERPVFVRGADPGNPTRIRGPVRLRGSYLVVENLDFDLAGSSGGVRIQGHHIVLRHSAVHGFRPGRNSTALYVSQSEDVVVRHTSVYDNGDFTRPGEQDVHGVGAGETRRLWVLDSHLYRNRGDGIQIGHRAANTVGPVYVARNDMHENGENSIDIKEASDVVISENRLHHEPPGNPVVVLHYCPVNAAVMANDIEDAEVGVSVASLLRSCEPRAPIDVFVLGNAFRRVSKRAIEGWGSGKRYHVAGNCFESVGVRIKVQNEKQGSLLAEGEDGLSRALEAFGRAYGAQPPPALAASSPCRSPR
jgi:hypothetical protein